MFGILLNLIKSKIPGLISRAPEVLEKVITE
jgi:hypothetical protein